MTSRRLVGVLAALAWFASLLWALAGVSVGWALAFVPFALVWLYGVLVVADVVWCQVARPHARVGGLGSAASAGFSGSGAGRPSPGRVQVGALDRREGGRS